MTKNVEEEGRADHEPAPILRRPTVERSALEPVQKLDHVTTFLVQVKRHCERIKKTAGNIKKKHDSLSELDNVLKTDIIKSLSLMI